MIKLEKMEKEEEMGIYCFIFSFGGGNKNLQEKVLGFWRGNFFCTIFSLFGQVLESYRHLVLNPSLDAHIQGNIRNLKNKNTAFKSILKNSGKLGNSDISNAS
jgi:hypothetical protein